MHIIKLTGRECEIKIIKLDYFAIILCHIHWHQNVLSLHMHCSFSDIFLVQRLCQIKTLKNKNRF